MIRVALLAPFCAALLAVIVIAAKRDEYETHDDSHVALQTRLRSYVAMAVRNH